MLYLKYLIFRQCPVTRYCEEFDHDNICFSYQKDSHVLAQNELIYFSLFFTCTRNATRQTSGLWRSRLVQLHMLTLS